jgi:hypothetical protein
MIQKNRLQVCKTRDGIHESRILLRFPGITSGYCRLEVLTVVFVFLQNASVRFAPFEAFLIYVSMGTMYKV